MIESNWLKNRVSIRISYSYDFHHLTQQKNSPKQLLELSEIRYPTKIYWEKTLTCFPYPNNKWKWNKQKYIVSNERWTKSRKIERMVTLTIFWNETVHTWYCNFKKHLITFTGSFDFTSQQQRNNIYGKYTGYTLIHMSKYMKESGI